MGLGGNVTAARWLGVACLCACLPAGAPVVSGGGREGAVSGHVTCRGLRDCSGGLVYVERIPGRTFEPGPPVTMDQSGLAFVPTVVAVVTGGTVVFPNSDQVLHNVFSASKAKRFNLGIYPKGSAKQMVFDAAGVVEVLCNVHPEMSAFIIVADTPYVAPVQANGSYALGSLPAGTIDVTAWHPRLKEQRQAVTVRDRETVMLNFDLR
jgi:hypothetical protein